ncbi:MAG: hypothetical protein NTX96_00930 [Candidatus Zambryskibacteria bacterium]|nr:hypothetical protein [Candidatus Zambryskibacteria bacterium]
MKLLKEHFIIFTFFFLLLPFTAKAQGTLFLSPSTGSYKVGELFSVLVNINTGGESINASMGQINFDNSRLQVVSLGFSQSIFDLWTSTPVFSNPAGTINFSGGIPSPGFTGASGSILRMTFKGIASGQAPVNFLSGSILANDGVGTNIVDNLKGALFTITPSDSPIIEPTPKKEPTEVVEVQKTISTPIITKWPRQLNEGDTLTIEGLGYPLTKISVIIQKDSDELISGFTFAGFDGKFRFTYADKVNTGYYNAWARNVAEDGNQSGLSDPVTVEVIAPTFIRIGGMVINYDTIIILLLLFLLLIILLLLLLWFFYRKRKKKQTDEISEAEHVLHESFETLKEGLSKYVAYLVNAKIPSEIKRREQKTKEELKDELENIETKINKEITDIR